MTVRHVTSKKTKIIELKNLVYSFPYSNNIKY